MGKQIVFVHLEEDVQSFLSVVEQRNGLVILDNEAFLPSQLKEYILKKMDTPFSKFFIVPHDSVRSRVSQIEFLNCTRGCATSRTYETGRLYIAPDMAGEYDGQALALYNQLCRYIKKNYLYSRNSQVYFSAGFKDKLDANYLFATNLGFPIHF